MIPNKTSHQVQSRMGLVIETLKKIEKIKNWSHKMAYDLKSSRERSVHYTNTQNRWEKKGIEKWTTMEKTLIFLSVHQIIAQWSLPDQLK